MAELIAHFRQDIDEIDLQLLGLLEKRFSIAQQIGRSKKTAGGIPIKNQARENKILFALEKKRRSSQRQSSKPFGAFSFRFPDNYKGKKNFIKNEQFDMIWM